MSNELQVFKEKLLEVEAKLSRTAKRTERVYQKVEGWTIEYPQIDKIVDEQMHSFWGWREIPVENDVEDLRVNMTVAEREAISYCLLLFTHYELRVGEDYWMNRIGRRFKRPEFQRMATMFSAVELNSHAPFYNQANVVLYLDDEEFYSKWKIDPVLVARMDFIEVLASSRDDLLSVAGFSFIEGSVLYSSFAFFKHFQAQACGKDLMKNFCRGINLSVADENTHAVGGALLFHILLEERGLTEDEKAELAKMIYSVAQMAYEHECEIINKIFSFGDIKGITKENLKDFVKHRIDLCLNNLKLKGLFDTTPNDRFIESWFYENINSFQLHDFFTGGGSEYDSNWSREKFVDTLMKRAKEIPYVHPVNVIDEHATVESYIVYGKEGCRFCAETKVILSDNNIKYTYIDVNKDLTPEEYEKAVLFEQLQFTSETRPKTLPQVVKYYDNGEFNYVGGGEDLVDDLFLEAIVTLEM